MATLFACGFAFSQNTFPTGVGTNVGIGTTSPSTRLQVTSATAGTSGIRMTNLTSGTAASAVNGRALSVDGSGNIISVPSTDFYASNGTLTGSRTVTMNGLNLTFNPVNAASQFFMHGVSGYVGIGTSSPVARFDVNGDFKATQGVFSISPASGGTFADFEAQFKAQYIINGGSLVAGNTFRRMFTLADNSVSNIYSKPIFMMGIEDRNDMNRFRFSAETGGATNLKISTKSQQTIMNIYEDGNDNVTMTLPKANSFLGIGTTSFTDGTDTYRFAVKGAIRADRVKVYTTWADYVFEKNYVLPTLEEVEKHIQEKGHLKDIPSAKEVEKNGIELGDMNKKLLQKVEELTLYLIEMNKELQAVKSQLKKD